MGTRVGVGVVVRSADGLVLVARRLAEPGRPFAVPGGRLDPGESVEECAVRELAEETGLVVKLAAVRTFTSILIEDAQGASWVVAGVEAQLGAVASDIAPVEREPDKVGAFAWIDPDDPPADLYPATTQLLAARR